MTKASAGSHGRPHIRIEPSRGWGDWLEMVHYRDLFLILARRDVTLRYRQTLLGLVWVILQPLIASLIFAAIFGVLADLPSDGAPYLLFVYAAMLAWNLFSGGVTRAGTSLITDSSLVTKVFFPRAIIPIASTFSALIDFAVAAVVAVVLMLLLSVAISPTLLGTALLVVLTMALTIGVSLLFSSLAVYYRDFAYALPFILQVWMYASPVVYSSSLIPQEYLWLYGLNPMAGVIEGFRWAILGGTFPALLVVESVLVTGVVLAAGAAVFGRIERSFADVI